MPPQIRVEVYEEAIKRNELPFGYSVGLCLLLPICLWDLKDCHKTTPDGTWWRFSETKLAFPELGDNLESLKQQLDDDFRSPYTTHGQRFQIRIDFLKKFIQQIQNTDTNENSIN